MTPEDLERIKGQKIKRLENLAKACAEARSDEMKKMWFDKLIELHSMLHKNCASFF